MLNLLYSTWNPIPWYLATWIGGEFGGIQPVRFRKGRGPGNQIANIHWIIEKAQVLIKRLIGDDQGADRC